MEPNAQYGNRWGLISPDGYFQPFNLLNADTLEYACKSVAQLEALLNEYIESELYEKCAIIRDELIRRRSN